MFYLKDDISKSIITEITAIQEREMESVVGLPRHREADFEALLDLADFLVC